MTPLLFDPAAAPSGAWPPDRPIEHAYIEAIAQAGVGAMVSNVRTEWRALRAGDRLRLQVGAGLAFDMFQVSPEVFYVPGPDWWVAFAGGERPAAMHVRGMFVDAIARRLP